MKTVLFAINDLNFGGGQRTLVSEANLLSERGYAVFVLTLLPTRDEASLQPLLKISAERIVRIPFSSFLSIGALCEHETLHQRCRWQIGDGERGLDRRFLLEARCCCCGDILSIVLVGSAEYQGRCCCDNPK